MSLILSSRFLQVYLIREFCVPNCEDYFAGSRRKKVTSIITGERGDSTLTRQGLEEYVSDCVIILDHRVTDQTSTRRLRIVKYRGTLHGTNEYPFLIDENGISVLPITSLGLTHDVTSERVSTGIKELDSMLAGKGYFRGSSILVSGTAGTGKSSLAAHFASASCKRGERVLYFSLEESPAQIIRNMNSIGIDLEPLMKKGKIALPCNAPYFYRAGDASCNDAENCKRIQTRCCHCGSSQQLYFC